LKQFLKNRLVTQLVTGVTKIISRGSHGKHLKTDRPLYKIALNFKGYMTSPHKFNGKTHKNKKNIV
jgi:hypothetical protein